MADLTKGKWTPYPQPPALASPLDTIRQTYPEAWVHFDTTARDCGYPKPWMVWSTQDDDMRCLGEGTTEPEALTDAVTNLEDV